MFPWLAKIIAARNRAVAIKNRARDYYNENTTEGQKLSIKKVVIVIIIIVFMMWFGKKAIEALRKNSNRDTRNLDVNKNNLTHSDSDFHSFAADLETAMQGAGTTETSVNEVLQKMNTQDDWNNLQQVFGVRKHDGGFWGEDYTGALKLWIDKEFSGSELEEIRLNITGKGLVW